MFWIVGITCAGATAAEPEIWRAGVARAKITPAAPMWMSGYAARDRPAEDTLNDLWAKALVIEDAGGHRVALVTLDLVGIDRRTSNRLRDRLQAEHGLSRSQVALCCSHTHSGPVVGNNLTAMYFLDKAGQEQVAEYTEALVETLVKLVGQAKAALEPARLAWTTGHATFAANRRNNPEADVARLRAEGNLKGPVDHDVPVLAVSAADGDLTAVVFGYACHATVLDGYQWSGDYPGFAQTALEQSHPGVTALFWAGCGADINPLPRRQVELARDYGKRLATAVDEALSGQRTPITGPLKSSYIEIELPFDKLPSTEQLKQEAASDNRYVASRARLLLAEIESGRPLAPTYPYPVQVWRLGGDVKWILLGGEVVVDYALELKHQLGPEATWVAGYTNDVMAYIPSRRVLGEGGYEGGGAMVYYGLPTVWAPQVEGLIVAAVDQLLDL